MPLSIALKFGRSACLAGCLWLIIPTSLMAQTAARKPNLVAMQIRRGGSYLGVTLGDLDEEHAKALKLNEVTGALVLGVEENEAAEKAGVRAGDVILLYNGETILGAQQLGRLVAETPPDRKVVIRVWRDSRSKDFTVTTGTRSALYWTANEIGSSAFVTDIPAPLMVWKNMILGLEYEPLNSQLAQFFGVKQGSLIRSVQPGSVADKAGIRAGDILAGLDGRLISSPREVAAAIRMDQRALKPLAIDISRERKSITVMITLSPPQ